MASNLCGYRMSWRQLDELWHLEAELAHLYIGLPLRQCSALPSESDHALPDEDFLNLKRKIRRMWIRASLDVESYNVNKEYENHLGELHKVGWGLRVRDGDPVSFPKSHFTLFGWLVEAPKIDQCPTGHRYLRSPAGSNMYLGGPISLCNNDKQPTIQVKFLSSSKEPRQFSVYVYTTSLLPPSTVLSWNYGLQKDAVLHDINEWKLEACCKDEVPCESPQKENPPTKRMRLLSSARKGNRSLPTSEFCMYCGNDLCGTNEDDNKSGKKVNMKSHLASNHCVQICVDGDLNYKVPKAAEALTFPEFLKVLHRVHEVVKILQKHNFVVVPACMFFKHSGYQPVHGNCSEEEKDQIFKEFARVASEAFKKYKVLYLRGSMVPHNYDHLLPLNTKTALKHIAWRDGVRPPSSSLSVAPYINEEEQALLAAETFTDVNGVLNDYNTLISGL